MSRQLTSFAAVVAFAFLLAACGGGGERLTRQQLIAKGDAICKEAQAKSESIGTNLANPTAESMPQWADALGQLIPVYEDLIGKLKALNPPEADQATWDKITGGLDQLLAGVKRAKDAASKGDLMGFQTALTAIGKASGTASQLATDYGFKECGAGTSGGASPAATAAATIGP